MTRTEISHVFETELEGINNSELAALTELSNDNSFAMEAGDEFLTAVAVVGLHRVLAV